MEQPLHVYTSEEIRLDELAKLDELGNTGNDKKKAVDPKKENTGNDKKKAVDPRKENTGNDKEEAVDPEKKNTGYKKKAVDLEEENTEEAVGTKEENTGYDKEEAVDPTGDNTGDDKKGVIDFKEENTGHKILIIIVHCLDHSILYQQRDFQRRAKKFPVQRGGAGGQDAVPLAPDRVRE